MTWCLGKLMDNFTHIILSNVDYTEVVYPFNSVKAE
jgi:hypothetical protein